MFNIVNTILVIDESSINRKDVIMKHYTIICEDCQATRKIAIVPTALGDRIDWLDDDPQERIVSGRQRLDGQFGWQCLCGNNSLLSSQEERGITNKVAPDPKEIQQIVQNLIPEKTNFVMEAI